MAIIKNVMVSINKDRAITDSQLYVYRNDHGILYKFTIRDVKYQFSSSDSNLVRELGGVSAIIDVINPQGKVVAQAKQPIVNDTVEFLLTKEMTDEIQDVGIHYLHIHLISASDGMVTLPPFRIEVKDNPICSFNKSDGNEPTPPTDPEGLEELEKAVGELGTRVTASEEKVAEMNKELTSGLDKVAKLAEDIDPITTQMTQLAKDVQSMDSKVESANKLSIENKAELTKIEPKVTKATTDATDALAKATTASEDAKLATDKIAEVTPTVTKLEKSEQEFRLKFEQLSAEFKTVQNDIVTVEKANEATNVIAMGNKEGLRIVGRDLVDIKARLDKLEKGGGSIDLSAVNAKIDKLQKSMDSLGGSVVTLTQRVTVLENKK